MQTKKLIELLQKADPSGELDCVCDNVDIFWVETEPGYYDGYYQKLIRDPALEDICYDIIGAEIIGHLTKVTIRTLDISGALLSKPDMPINCYNSERHKKRVWEERCETIEIMNRTMHWFGSWKGHRKTELVLGI